MYLFRSIASNAYVYAMGRESESTALQSLEGSHLVRITASFRMASDYEASDEVLSKDDALLRQKCELLVSVDLMVKKTRWPYAKDLPGQEYVYDRKYSDAAKYLATPTDDRDKILRDELHYLLDEAEIMKKEPLITALLIQQVRQERETIFRCSERARRICITKIGKARSSDELEAIKGLITDRNFRLPMEA